MKLHEYLDVSILDDHIAMGLVEKRLHPKFPLMILIYSRTTIYDNLWDDVTEKCRGLIVNYVTGDIVARPYEKFFNFDTSYRPETFPANLPCRPPLVTEKLDGSLGIFYQYRGQVGIASKGSFQSDHALWATAWYIEHIELLMAPEYPHAIWPTGYTPVFEMICQSVQHHVIHYDKDRLVLLAMINNESGEELDPQALYAWAGAHNIEPVKYHAKTLAETIAENRPGFEGYVLTWQRPGQAPIKIKVKHQEFLAYQKIVHGTSPKTVFEALRDGRKDLVEDWQQHVSPYLRASIAEWVTNYEDEYMLILAKAMSTLTPALVNFTQRKDFAKYLQEPDNAKYQHVCFAVLDEKDYKPIIWDMVERLVKQQKVLLESEEHNGNVDTYDGSRGSSSGSAIAEVGSESYPQAAREPDQNTQSLNL